MKDFDYYYDLFEKMLDLYEFDLEVDDDNFFRVVDRQGGNLGQIEQEQFNTLADIVDRMESYHNDYIVRAFEECLPEIEYSNWGDLYKRLIELAFYKDEDLSEFEFDVRILDMIVNGGDILNDANKNKELKTSIRGTTGMKGKKIWVLEKLDEYDGQANTNIKLFETREKAEEGMNEMIRNEKPFIDEVREMLSDGNMDCQIQKTNTYMYVYDGINFNALTISIREVEVK